MADEITFGTLLREARLRAGFATLTAFADHLSTLGLAYTDDAIGHWEKDRRKPPHDVALRVLSALAEAGGVTTLAEVSRMLRSLGRRDLDAQERTAYFPALAYTTGMEYLPARPFDRLVGRDDIVAELVDHLANPAARPVIVVSGLGGIGKTAIAYEVATRAMVSGRFDALAWQSARSEEFAGVTIRVRQEQRVNPHGVLLTIAGQLGFGALASLPPDALRRQLREAVRAGSYLVVLDNLESLEAVHEVAALLHSLVSPAGGARPSKVLITSRERLVDVDVVYDRFVRGLSEPASLDLLRDEANARGAKTLLQADEALLRRIFTTTGGMPLALKLVVSQALLGIALDEELARLEGVVDEQDIYRFIYFAIWRKLSRPAQKLLIGAATFRVGALRSMLQPVSELDDPTFNRAVAELVRMALLEAAPHALVAQMSYDIHAMTRWFVNGPLTELWNRQKAGGPPA